MIKNPKKKIFLNNGLFGPWELWSVVTGMCVEKGEGGGEGGYEVAIQVFPFWR